MLTTRFCLPLFLALLHFPFAAEAIAAYPIAGLAPHQRPDGAPRVEIDSPVNLTQVLHGIPAPRPRGLAFVESMGRWYTPFVQPGMYEPYDQRGWHILGTNAGEKR